MIKRKTYPKIIIIILLFLFYPSEIFRYQDSVFPNNVYGTKVYTTLLKTNTKERPGTTRLIKYIIIHETANEDSMADAKSHGIYLANKSSSVSWHYTVDDHSIYHHIPDNEVAFHVGNSYGNLTGIGIELCVNQGSNFNVTFDNGAKLCAYLLNAYDLDISAIKQHHDFSGKDCPHHIRSEDRMNEFNELVEYYLDIE